MTQWAARMIKLYFMDKVGNRHYRFDRRTCSNSNFVGNSASRSRSRMGFPDRFEYMEADLTEADVLFWPAFHSCGVQMCRLTRARRVLDNVICTFVVKFAVNGLIAAGGQCLSACQT